MKCTHTCNEMCAFCFQFYFRYIKSSIDFTGIENRLLFWDFKLWLYFPSDIFLSSFIFPISRRFFTHVFRWLRQRRIDFVSFFLSLLFSLSTLYGETCALFEREKKMRRTQNYLMNTSYKVKNSKPKGNKNRKANRKMNAQMVWIDRITKYCNFSYWFTSLLLFLCCHFFLLSSIRLDKMWKVRQNRANNIGNCNEKWYQNKSPGKKNILYDSNRIIFAVKIERHVRLLYR